MAFIVHTKAFNCHHNQPYNSALMMGMVMCTVSIFNLASSHPARDLQLTHGMVFYPFFKKNGDDERCQSTKPFNSRLSSIIIIIILTQPLALMINGK
uniref:Uncharacterized protein n=1 Tax=Tetranychus urticae TaxID=32264 RepID=T1JR90_TETUR